MAKQRRPRAPSKVQAESRRGAAFVLTLEERIRAAGIPEPRRASVQQVSLAGYDPRDKDVFDALARVPARQWESHRKKPHAVDLAEAAALGRTVERTARARGLPPLPAGRKPPKPELLALEAAREDRELDAAVDAARAAYPAAPDVLHDALASIDDEARELDGVRNELHDAAERVNYEETIATGAQTTLPTGANWMPKRQDVSKSVVTGGGKPAGRRRTGDDGKPK